MERLVINILNEHVKVAYDDVLQRVFIEFPNALTPNVQSVREVLDEYAYKTPDKKWMLKPAFKQVLDEHDSLVKQIADLGKRLGFDVHADIDDYRKADFPFAVENKDRVKEIDVIWYKGKQAVALFEVEHTTGITEAIVRGGNISGKSFLSVLVVPEERFRLLRRKVREPVLKEQIVKLNWKMISYGDLHDFLSKHKKREPTLDALRKKMIRLEDFKPEIQETMQKFM